jgi:MoaA/NifB/PqqE/SkfB family radical SAM enzyme
MNILEINPPISLGLILSYRCNVSCKYCIYACSPKWKGNWLKETDAEIIFQNLSYIFNKIYTYKNHYTNNHISFSYGLHLTGGEPFLNFKLLLKLAKLANEFKIPLPFVETNCFWAKNDEVATARLKELKEAGMVGILVSVNPFNVEYIPFNRIERVARIGKQIFQGNLVVYQDFYMNLFKRLKVDKTISFEEFLKKVNFKDLYSYIELLPMGRAPYKLGYLYKKYNASYFFNQDCKEELTRNYHTHIDNYCNYLPGFCAGISLGNFKDFTSIFGGINLSEKPILKALTQNMESLFKISKEYGYEESPEGYISKCHLCLDVRKHIIKKTGEFSELAPLEFYRMI